MNKSSNTNSIEDSSEILKPTSEAFHPFWIAQRARIQARIATYRIQAIEAQIEQLKLEIILARYRGKEAALQNKDTDIQLLNLEITEKFYQVEHLKEDLVNARRTQEQCTSTYKELMAGIPSEKLWDAELAKMLSIHFGANVEKAEALCKEISGIDLELLEAAKDSEPGRAVEEMIKLRMETMQELNQLRLKA